ncbi:MAG TPA: AAA family ATPase [Rhodopila sp.]|jgi:hypothetical protein|nr:AAA family ATPase [Rhodopila sp.]
MEDNPDAIRKAYEQGGFRPRLVHGSADSGQRSDEPFALRPLRIADQRSIPHRQWIYGAHLIRGFVTLLVAPGGTGKSSLLLAMCMAIATGRALLGTRIHQQCNAAILNLEDPQDEIDRRLTALAMHYGVTDEDIAGRLFASPAERVVNIAGIGDDGFSVVHPDEKQIIERVRDENIGVLGVDPFAESHTLEENSNPAMIKAAAAWRRVARSGNCSVILAHHVRKGMVDSIEAARGAKALTDSARIGLLLSSMTEADASDLGIPAEDRLQYVRLDDAKANMSARAPKASWFRLATVTLDNADATYPQGDRVGVIESWQPTSVWDATPVPTLNEALDRIDAGLPGGSRYTNSRRGESNERWAGTVLMDLCNLQDGQAAAMIKTWIKNGVLEVRSYRDPIQRHDRMGLWVNATKRPGAVHG